MRRFKVIVVFIMAACTLGIAQDKKLTGCPDISISGPAGIVNTRELADYTLAVGAEVDDYPVEFVWTASTGRIKDGQGTRTIRVIQPDAPVTVTVKIKGLPAGCPSTASAWSSRHPQPEPVKIYELQPTQSIISRNVEVAARAALENPTNQLYILAGDVGRKSSTSFLKRERDIVNLLTQTGVGPDRISISRVYSDVELFQFWLVPPGASNPRCIECEKLDKAVHSCPTISVTGPPGIVEPGRAYQFKANFSRKLPPGTRLEWTVSSGELLEGQGTAEIHVFRPAEGEAVTATLKVIGLAKECPHTASATAAIVQAVSAILVDEFSVSVSQLEKKRLSLAVADKAKNPNSQLYIIEYFQEGTSEFAIRDKVKRLSQFLRTELKLDSTMFEIVTHRDGKLGTKIYLIPPGADNPSP